MESVQQRVDEMLTEVTTNHLLRHYQQEVVGVLRLLEDLVGYDLYHHPAVQEYEFIWRLDFVDPLTSDPVLK